MFQAQILILQLLNSLLKLSNLQASQYGTNPYYIAQSLMEEAKRSVIIQGIDEDLTELWRSAFFIGTFDPRH